MAQTDVERSATNAYISQEDFSGGMNLIADPQKMPANTVRRARNVDVRTGDLTKALGQRSYAQMEIGGKFYDRYFGDVLDASLWKSFATTAGSAFTINADQELEITGPTTPAWDESGVLSLRVTPINEDSYFEIGVKAPSTLGSNIKCVVQLATSNTALNQGTNIGIRFDDDNSIKATSAGSSLATIGTVVADATYRIRIEKTSTGYDFACLDLTNNTILTHSLVIATITTAFVKMNVFGGTWTFDDILYHEGFNGRTKRIASNGGTYFTREVVDNEIIVCAWGNIYKYTKNVGYDIVATGFDDTARFRFRVFNDELIGVNGTDNPFRYNGSTVADLGSGATKAPIANAVEVHLQTIFLLDGNSLFRNVVGNINSWDALQPTVDLDAWKGDVGVGLLVLDTNLYVIKSASVWVLTGTTNNSFRLRRLRNTRGCIAPDSIASDGQIAFWLGPDGIYKFDGVSTELVSYRVHPLFNFQEPCEFPKYVDSKFGGSFGIIHDFKYRLSLVEHGEGSMENNSEIVFDFIGNSGQGAFTQRNKRTVGTYISLVADKGTGELLYLQSEDGDPSLMQAEIGNGNFENAYGSVTRQDQTNKPFIGEVWSSYFIARGITRDLLDKTFNNATVGYQPRGSFVLGLRIFTRNRTKGHLEVFDTKRTDGHELGALVAVDVDDAFPLMDQFSEEKSDFLVYDEEKDGTRGSEVWWLLTQDDTVRTEAKIVWTAPGGTPAVVHEKGQVNYQDNLLQYPGNWEPFSVKRIAVRLIEDNQ